MATTTRAVLRQEVKENVGDYWSLSTNASGGGADTTTVIADNLENLPDGNDDDAFEGWYVTITESGHSSVGQERRASDYAQTTQDITTVAFTANVGNSTAFELSRWSQDDYHAAIKRAIIRAYPVLYKSITDESLVIDNLLTDGGFEGTLSGGAFPAWTNVNSPTVRAETTTVYHLTQSAQVISHASSGAAQLTESLTVNINEVAGQTATFKMRVWSATKDEARVRIDWDGTNFDNSDYHTGDSEWRELTASGTVPTDATKILPICEVIVGTKTAYFDAGYLTIGPVYKYTIPATIIKGPYFVREQYNANDVNGVYFSYPEYGIPTAGRVLQLEGIGLLSRPTTDAETTEVGEPHVRYIVELATAEMFKMMAYSPRSAQSQRDHYRQFAQDWELRARETAERVRMPRLSAEVPKNSWRTKDGSLIFVRPREGVSL